MGIITSLLDNDLYKFTMMQAVYNQCTDPQVEYEFKCRNDINLTKYASEISDEINEYCKLKFTYVELKYLDSLPYIKKDFVEFLSDYQPNRRHIIISTKGNKLQIRVEGAWLLTILLEVPILAIVNEVYFRNTIKNPDYTKARQFLHNKLDLVKDIPDFKFAEFGTRRRFSKEWQADILDDMCVSGNLIGTSNVLLAKCYELTPIGTMAHEWAMAWQALDNPVDSQKTMLDKWIDEYRGDLGIALTDTIGIDAFLKDFDLYFAKLYDGVRHDSGDSYNFADKVIAHYTKLNIDPKTKTIIFSDGLNFNKAVDILKYCANRINVSFGIGTNLTNDFPNIDPLPIVMKMQKCNGQPVAKISDAPGKAQCQDIEYLKSLKEIFKVGESR